MKKLRPNDPDARWDQGLTVKTPDDVYRAELRITMWPTDELYAVGVEVTHENSRELISWIYGGNRPVANLRNDLPEWFAEVLNRLTELAEPF